MKIRMTLINWGMGLFLLFGVSALQAQASLSFFAKNDSLFSRQRSFAFQALEIQQGPQPILKTAYIPPDPGYLSYLCRKELEIEKKLPIGIWINIGEPESQLIRHPGAGAVSNVRFKLLKF